MLEPTVSVPQCGVMTICVALLLSALTFTLRPVSAEVPSACGNGELEATETCDDGNLVDGDCCSALCQLEANLPPDCRAASATTDQLWPPNHALVPVRIGGVADPDGDPVAIAITAIAQDEPVDATGDGATCPDGIGVGSDTASLRSERSGQGDGRTYHVAFQAVDRCGVACTGTVSVCVRHSRRPNGTCGDGGPLYDSTLGEPTCQGEVCDPERCVPEPHALASCEDQVLPPPIVAQIARARDLLSRAANGKQKQLGRRASKQLAKAVKRAGAAARQGVLSEECAASLSDALLNAETCAACHP
jgi:cysteine-rich repeat protein